VKRTIDVLIGGEARLVGRLHHDRRGHREASAFAYDARWLADPDRFAIDPSTSLTQGFQYPPKLGDGVFHAAIADTEPDGWAKQVILRDHAKRRALGESIEGPLDALGFLLAVDDESRVGALRFRDEAGVIQRAAEGTRRTPPLMALADLFAATRAVESNRETAADLEYLRGRGTSIGGLRPKCSVLEEDGRLSIGKFPSVQDTRPVTKGEVLALRLASLAGIDAASARIVNAGDTPVAVIRRFDRPARGKRLLYVSAATLLGADPARDHMYTQIVDAIRIHGAAAREDIDELWRRIAFSISISNVDDHLRNHGFLHVTGGRWRLAPAFDLNPFPDRAREFKTWISEDTGPVASRDALMSVVPYFQLTSARAREILHEVERAVARWRDEGRRLGLTTAELELFAPAFEHAERPRRASRRRATRPRKRR
jgi:serine/threonine-protein kinase HipA